jgi:excisionase family DNA binding protein
MKSHPTQFGVRENTASSRQHASRLDVDNASHAVCIEEEMPDMPRSSPLDDPPTRVFGNPFHAAAPLTATGHEGRDVVDASAVMRPRTVSHKSTSSFEPLISSQAAAKLLGDIHVKTLQRYARRGSLPGYQIGGHWYFRASELDGWLQSRFKFKLPTR